MIVKVQRSLYTTHDRPRMLIYDRERSIRYESDMTTEVSLLLKTKPKVYCEAKWNPDDGTLALGKVVRGRSW